MVGVLERVGGVERVQPDVNVVIWSWCGQVSGASVPGGSGATTVPSSPVASSGCPKSWAPAAVAANT